MGNGRFIGSFAFGRMRVLAAIALCLVFVRSLPAEDFQTWLTTQRDASERKLLAKIGRNGAVIASPAEYTPGQNYYFHWIRDAALSMDVVVSLYDKAPAADKPRYWKLLDAYVEFSNLNQTLPQPALNPPLTGLGEPKFEITGKVFARPWGRPQNDGPALRAITLMRIAAVANANGQPLPPKLVEVVKKDLGYVAQEWPNAGTDLWEEVDAQHFFTRMVQRRALIDGVAFAQSHGFPGEVPTYQAAVNGLTAAIETHARPDGRIEAIQGNDRLDVAVVLGVIHGYTPKQPLFTPADDRVLKTAWLLRKAFVKEYPINTVSADSDGKLIEPGIGRYPDDEYDGANNGGGNPWFLATAALAELCYRAADIWAGPASVIHVTDKNRDFLLHAAQMDDANVSLPTSGDLHPGDPRHAAVVAGLKEMGDRFLRRIRLHGAPDGTLSEQFSRNSGFMTSAQDLTWSYAALLTAMEQRHRP